MRSWSWSWHLDVDNKIYRPAVHVLKLKRNKNLVISSRNRCWDGRRTDGQERNQAVASLVQNFNMTHCLFQLQHGVLTRVEVAFGWYIIYSWKWLLASSLHFREELKVGTQRVHFSFHNMWNEQKVGKKSLPYRVVTRYVGLRSGIKGLGPGIKSPGSGIKTMGSWIRGKIPGTITCLDLTNRRTLTLKI